jgi:hypothetical protein
MSDNFVLLFCLTTFWKISYKLSLRKACKVRQSTRLTKKLMLSRVQVKRIKSDIPACNFNRNSRLHCRFARVWRGRGGVTQGRESALFLDGFSRSMRSFSVPRLRSDTAAGPESRRNDSGDSVGGRKFSLQRRARRCRETKTQSRLDTTASVQAQPTVRLKRGGVINKDACP